MNERWLQPTLVIKSVAIYTKNRKYPSVVLDKALESKILQFVDLAKYEAPRNI